MTEIPTWPCWLMMIIGVVEILITKNKKLMDIWYSIDLMKYTKCSKQDAKNWTLISGIGLIVAGILGLIILLS